MYSILNLTYHRTNRKHSGTEPGRKLVIPFLAQRHLQTGGDRHQDDEPVVIEILALPTEQWASHICLIPRNSNMPNLQGATHYTQAPCIGINKN